MQHLKLDYLELTPAIEAVDDGASIFYNCIVDNTQVTVDWNSSEKMLEEPRYVLGLVVNHNFPTTIPGKGSAIFMHNWCDEDWGTSGCTSMRLEHVEEILNWLDKDKNPILVQLPLAIYTQLQPAWNLP